MQRECIRTAADVSESKGKLLFMCYCACDVNWNSNHFQSAVVHTKCDDDDGERERVSCRSRYFVVGMFTFHVQTMQKQIELATTT